MGVDYRDFAPSTEQGVRALFANLIPGDKPLTPEQLEWCRQKCREGSTLENGVYTFTYTFDGPTDQRSYILNGKPGSFNARTIPESERAKIREALAKFSEVAGLAFKEATPEQALTATKRIFMADIPPDEQGGPIHGFAGIGPINHVLLNSNLFGKNDSSQLQTTVLHEFIHTVKGSHPGGDEMHKGGDPAYDQPRTIMSLAGGRGTSGFGDVDFMWLRTVFGPSKNVPAIENPVPLYALTQQSYLYTPNQVLSLDLRDPCDPTTHTPLVGGAFHMKGNDLYGGIPDPEGKPFPAGYSIDLRVLGTEDIKDLLADDTTKIHLELRGNKLPNILQGGAEENKLAAQGGNDVLMGGKGKTEFVLYHDSGFNNAITGLKNNPGNSIYLGYPVSHVELRYCEDLSIRGNSARGTQMYCTDNDGVAVASAVISDATPIDVLKALAPKGNLSVNTPTATLLTPSSTHPSGLPESADVKKMEAGLKKLIGPSK